MPRSRTSKSTRRAATLETTPEASKRSVRSQLADLLARLQYWLPATQAVDWSQAPAAIWRGGPVGGGFRVHDTLNDVGLDDLHGVDRQKAALVANTAQFVAGLPANNALLWGARGTGKSSLIHALLNRYHPAGLRLIQIDKQQLDDLPELVAQLAGQPYRFVLFCDDLSFEANDPGYKAVKSALDGSVFRTTANLVIYATSNRRHLLPESMSDNQQSHMQGGELHAGEAIEEKISLSDRFGLWLSFYQFDQHAYLQIAQHWVEALAQQHDVKTRWDDGCRAEALRWALARGVRSGRTAQHFARHWVGLSGQSGDDAPT